MEKIKMNNSNENLSTVSYVVPRVPSITGFGQRKIDGKSKKKLFYSLEKCDDSLPKIDVCLRLKPRTHSIPTGELDTLTILSDNTVAYSSGNAREDITRYTFSSVFGPNVDQKRCFDTWMYDKVLRFLNGNNELLFAYGTTNAGKTYTMHGNLNDPGIIPRTLLLVFNTLNNKLMSRCKCKPDQVNGARMLDEHLIKAEECIRNNILNNWCDEKIQDGFKYCASQTDQSHTISSAEHLTSNNITKMFDQIKDVGTATLDHGNVSYTVWVSYSEINNESIYDLLATNSPKQSRTPLKLALDQDKNVYVKDLRHVFVQSADEAYKMMIFGKNNFETTSNVLNRSTSDSHCIFTLKLIRVENIENPDAAVVSSIWFCDLAGSKSLKKTLNVGDRLVESRSVNTSLFVLNKCFSVLRENKTRGENNLVPCRESKLTQVFQTALTGCYRTNISTVVNVDISASSYEETKQVLLMFAVARSITNCKKKTITKPRPGSAVWAANNFKRIAQAESKQNSINEGENSNESNNEKLPMISRKHFEIRIKEELTKLRQQLLSEFRIILNTNETFYKNQKVTADKRITETYENKIQRIKDHYQGEIREINGKLTSNQVSLYNHKSDENKCIIENYENRTRKFEEENEKLLAKINALKNMEVVENECLNAKNQEIENYKIMLDEAKTEYERRVADLDEINNRFDRIFQDKEEKVIEIERLTSSIEAKDNIITDMEEQQEKLIAETSEQKMLAIMDEKLEIIVGLENTIKKLETENNQQVEETSQVFQQYLLLKKHLKAAFDESDRPNENNSKLSDKDLEISKLQERQKQLEFKLKEIEIMAKKPKNRNVAVLTDLSKNDSALPPESECKEREKKLVESLTRTVGKCRLKLLSAKGNNKLKPGYSLDDRTTLDEAIDNIPYSTRTRRLYDGEVPFANSTNMTSHNILELIPTPAQVLFQISKLRTKN